jgi:hypothetical protein
MTEAAYGAGGYNVPRRPRHLSGTFGDRKRRYAMDVADRENFLACLDCDPDRNCVAVFAHAKRHLIAAIDETGFDDFHGPDFEVVGRLAEHLAGRTTEAALWGLAFIDLWYCSNFGGRHWGQLVAHDPGNARYAIEAAYWVFAVSGRDGGAALAGILNRCRCWGVAGQYVRGQAGKWQRAWWQRSVLPGRDLSRAERVAAADRPRD